MFLATVHNRIQVCKHYNSDGSNIDESSIPHRAVRANNDVYHIRQFQDLLLTQASTLQSVLAKEPSTSEHAAWQSKEVLKKVGCVVGEWTDELRKILYIQICCQWYRHRGMYNHLSGSSLVEGRR